MVKPGGTIAFMDEIQTGEMTDEECKKFLFPQAVPYLETLEGYASLLEKAGFTVLEEEDITGEVMEYWRRVWMDDIKAKKDEIVGKFGNEMYDNLCIMMENLFTAGPGKKDWRRQVHLRSRESTRDFAVTLLGAGTPEAIRFFQARYEELQEMVGRGEGAVPQERHRITWLYALPYFDLSIADYMAERHGATIVVDLFSHASAEVDMGDTSDPIAFLARKTYKGGLVKGAYGSYDNPAAREDFLKMCSEYGSDAVILLAHWGCKQYRGLSKLLKDDIQAEVGLPLLTLDADIIDPRIVSSSRVKAKLDEFFATLG